MGVDVQYRDLPGGTRRLRFADELPQRLMCGTCGMLSMHMFEDKQGHAFCNVCVCQKSQAAAIFCEYEKNNVSLDELVESFDINQIIKDQMVFCPNEQKGCSAYTPLSDIEDHYLQCEKTEIECGQCQQRIRGCHWKSHTRNCPRKIVQCRYCVTAFPQIDLQTHEVLCTENPNCITSSTAQQSLLRNASALPVSGDRSEYASSDMTSPTRDPVKIRHQGWPWWFLPVVICFTCLTFFPRTVVNVFLKPLLDTALRINAEHHESSSTASEEDDAGIQFWSLSIRHLQNHVLTCVAIVGDFPIVSFFRRNVFVRNFGFPLLAIVWLSLLVRRRRNH